MPHKIHEIIASGPNAWTLFTAYQNMNPRVWNFHLSDLLTWCTSPNALLELVGADLGLEITLAPRTRMIRLTLIAHEGTRDEERIDLTIDPDGDLIEVALRYISERGKATAALDVLSQMSPTCEIRVMGTWTPRAGVAMTVREARSRVTLGTGYSIVEKRCLAPAVDMIVADQPGVVTLP